MKGVKIERPVQKKHKIGWKISMKCRDGGDVSGEVRRDYGMVKLENLGLKVTAKC